MSKQFDWLNPVKEYARDYVLENTGLKFLALLVTAVLWLSVASRPVSEITMYNVPIEFKNIPDSPPLTVSKYDAPSLTARVYIRGPRDVLDTLRLGDLTAYADLYNVEPGVRVITLQVDSVRLPASLVARVVEPRSIRVTVEPMVEREVPVLPRLDGEPASGFEVVSKNIAPSTVRITGAASQVQDIKEVSTETVSLTGRTSTFSEWVTVDIGNPNVNLKDEASRKVMLTVNIGESRRERVIDRVPIIVDGAPAGRKADPLHVSVTVSGPVSAIDAITLEDITVSVDASEAGRIRRLTPVVTLSPAYSDKVLVRSVEPKTVSVR
jgi:YbbR domain-containing protein